MRHNRLAKANPDILFDTRKVFLIVALSLWHRCCHFSPILENVAMQGRKILSIGELLVEFVSHDTDCGLKKLATYSGPYPSGAPAICVDQAARVGAPAMIFGSVGADAFGEILIDRLKNDGVDTTGIETQSDKTTGVAFVSYFADGGRTFIFHLTNTAADAIGSIGKKMDDPNVILHISGASLGNPLLRKAILEGCDAVKRAGGIISCDPNARPELMRNSEARKALDKIMNSSGILFPSSSDLAFLYPGMQEDAAIETMRSRHNGILAWKKGADGAVVFARGASTTYSGHNVDEVDPTGAGDCFCGTFLAMLALGHDIEEAGLYANAAGAIAVTRRGPMEGNSDLPKIQKFLKENSLLQRKQEV
jgi:sugar/nucleoside kinase (ribokinase family)